MPLSTLHIALKKHNAAQNHSEFENTAFTCTICFENRQGRACVQMPECGCVFCTDCLSSCWSLAIKEGSVENVACPSFDCVKSRGSEPKCGGMSVALVTQVVGEEWTERWEFLRSKRIVETGELAAYHEPVLTCRPSLHDLSPAKLSIARPPSP